jgi:hypothetical protein
MLTVLFVALLVISVAAPFCGVDTSDARIESARPERGWFPVG